ncbi:hypothetical protein CRUP_002007 [Coryphaenoides rupestris]|nr:hypothetical protein CRUP_002007 [Coryphaenoides rupestris]
MQREENKEPDNAHNAEGQVPHISATVSSDKHQTQGIAALVERFNWETVGVVGSDDEYGSESLLDHLGAMVHVCVDFKVVLPGYFDMNGTRAREELGELMGTIQNSTAEAVVLFTKESNVMLVIEAAIRMNLSRTLDRQRLLVQVLHNHGDAGTSRRSASGMPLFGIAFTLCFPCILANLLARTGVALVPCSPLDTPRDRPPQEGQVPHISATVSSDKHQTQGIAALVERFNWETVGVVGSDDEYGSESLLDHLGAMVHVCVDFKVVLPGYFDMNGTRAREELGELMGTIQNSTAEAVVLFTKESNVMLVIEAAIRMNLSRTWIASDSWSKSSIIMEMPGIEAIGSVFGFIFKSHVVPGFADQILVGFNFAQNVGGWLKRLNQPPAVVAVLFGVQLVLCSLWLAYYPPSPLRRPSDITIVLECDTGSTVLFGAMLGYVGLLAVVCFLFAFNGRRLPDLYKNASFVTIGMLLFLVVWIVFIPIYIHRVGNYTRAIEAAAILVSSYSMLTCHLVPKCYIMVCRRELNDERAITDYIKKHYEQKGITVLKS